MRHNTPSTSTMLSTQHSVPSGKNNPSLRNQKTIKPKQPSPILTRQRAKANLQSSISDSDSDSDSSLSKQVQFMQE